MATIKHWFGTGPGEKAGMVDGLNLFFGALLGANLGTMQGMGLSEYIKLIVLLAGTVVTLRMVSTSERRGRMLLVASVYAVLIAAVLLVPGMQPKGLAASDLHRLAATLGVWVAFVLIAELTPMQSDDSKAEGV